MHKKSNKLTIGFLAVKKLIVNADDFGLSQNINFGILDSFRNGILTSATFMVNMPAFEHAASLAKENPNLDTGLHLNITTGFPVAHYYKIPSLVCSSGRFKYSSAQLLYNSLGKKLKIHEIYIELKAQVEKFLNIGLNLSHIDSHHHFHIFPTILPVVIQLTKEYKIPAIRLPYEKFTGNDILKILKPNKRKIVQLVLFFINIFNKRFYSFNSIYRTDHFFGISTTGSLNKKSLKQILYRMKEGVTEIMTHPGYIDTSFFQPGIWLKEQREAEVKALTNTEIKKFVKENNIILT
ncbi:MAG: carbohydrate deacetylase, partial [Candidatus Hodarchaeota archaeon]